MTCLTPDCQETPIDFDGMTLCPSCDEDWIVKCEGCGELIHADDAVNGNDDTYCNGGHWHAECLSEARQSEADAAYDRMMDR